MNNFHKSLLWLFLLSVMAQPFESKASHALGADLTYQCLGGDQYLIRLAFYRDCGGISAPSSATVDINGCSNFTVNLTLQPAPVPSPPFDAYLAPYEVPVYCSATNCGGGTQPGLQEYIYEATVTLAPCASWTMSYSLCCRSAAINTISNSDDEDIYVEAFLNNQAAPCNSSPVFDVPSRGFLCIGQDNQILGTATDVDGDLLVYSLYTPMTSSTGNVNYNGGFNANNPLTNNYFNFNNGVIDTWPTSSGQVTVMGILIQEYRNGILIGSIVRDMQIRMVDNCPQNPGNDFDIDQDGVFDEDTIVLCADNPVQLDVYLNNIVPGRIYGMNVDNMADFPGAAFNTTPDGTQPGSVIGHFIWTPTAADIGTQQTLVFSAYDDNCPVVGYANFTYQFTITGLELDVGIDTVAISCIDSTEMVASASNGTPPYSYLWEDGSTNPARWVTAGQFWVVVTDDEGCTGNDTIEVYYIDDPVAQFTVQNACVDSAIEFSDQSFSNFPLGFPVINIVDWQWDFGDGATQNGMSDPSHSYDSTGIFSVELIATNDLGCKDTTDVDLIVNPVPEPAFSGAAVCEGSFLDLVDQSTIVSGNVVGWNWQLGETGATDNSQNTSYQYSTWGYFDVTLTAVSDSGCPASVTAPVYVAPYPVANFIPTDVCLNVETQFQGQSTIPAGTVTGWVWDFDQNSNTSNVQDPLYTYSTYGTFDVELIAYSDSGCTDTVVLPVTVHPLPIAGFTFDTACAELATTFIDTTFLATGNLVSWNWDFGDGFTSQMQSPTHVYSDGGTYTVLLVSESEYGCADSISIQVLVYPKPVADFTDFDACLNLPNSFTDASSVDAPGVIDQWEWNYGDNGIDSIQNPTYIYTNDGVYNVTLMVETVDGCRDTVINTTEVYVLPLASFNFSDVCQEDAPYFDNQSIIAQGAIVTNEWDFGLPGMTSTDQQPLGIQYPDSGHFDVQLITTSNQNCADTLVQTIEIFAMPEASFTFDNACWPTPVMFANLSDSNGVYPIDDWKWDFGDAQISTESDPENSYVVWGTYDVSLLVTTTQGCADDTIVTGIVVYPKPVADFANDIAFCQQDTGYFQDLSTLENVGVDSILFWHWDFADGQVADVPDTLHYFDPAAFYPVSLAVETNHGCQDTVTIPVEVYPHPLALYSVDTNQGCQPFLAQFIDESTIAGNYMISAWDWNFGDGTENVTASEPSNVYMTDTLGPFDVQSYTVSLVVTSVEGCSNTDTMVDMITIHPVPEALYTASPNPADILFPLIQFTDNSSANVVNWDWVIEDLAIINGVQNPSYEFPDTGIFTVTEYVITDFGCADTAISTVEVNPHFTFYIPNAFTPNNDGVNEYFFGLGTYISSYQMFIHDRWGELIFESYEEEDFWDGLYEGKAAPQGVYVYTFELIDVEHEPHHYKGHVTLTR